jgi:hypothetical protein
MSERSSDWTEKRLEVSSPPAGKTGGVPPSARLFMLAAVFLLEAAIR